MQHVGYLRHLLLRRANTTGEILVNLVTTSQEEMDLTPLKEALLALDLEGKIVGFLHIINDGLSDMVRSDETRILYGQDYFYEEILGLKFKVTPFSFFQPNSYGAEVLYNTAREYLGSTKDMTVFDLYSGTGTISQILAPVAKEVIGVEIVEEAVRSSKSKCSLNGIENCHFIAGDVLKVIDEIKENQIRSCLTRQEMESIQKHCQRLFSMEWIRSCIFPVNHPVWQEIWKCSYREDIELKNVCAWTNFVRRCMLKLSHV